MHCHVCDSTFEPKQLMRTCKRCADGAAKTLADLREEIRARTVTSDQWREQVVKAKKRIMGLLRERMESQHGHNCECDDCLTVKQHDSLQELLPKPTKGTSKG